MFTAKVLLLVGANNTGNGASGTQQAIQNVAVTVSTDTVGGQATGVFYFNGVEKPKPGKANLNKDIFLLIS